MSVCKYIFIGVLLLSLAFAIDIRMPDSLNLSEGEVRDIQINITNNMANSNTIGISVDSGNFTMPVKISSYIINMDRYSSTNITAAINAKSTEPGEYKITFLFASTEENLVFSRVLKVNIQQAIEITPVYSYVKAMQGDFVTLKFIISNLGKSGRNMIIDPESFPVEFNTQYPDPFYLDPGESKTVSVKITIPTDYHSGISSQTISVLSGEVRAESPSFDLSILKRSAFRNVVNIDAVELGGYIGDNGQRGYNLMLRIDNRKDEPVTGIEVSGFPLGWNVTGDTPFSIDANSVKDINLRIFPTDLGERVLDVLLTKDSAVLTNTTLTFSGSRAGLVGAAFFGGSLTVGLLIIVVLVLVLLYIRQKNVKADEGEKADYLKGLFDEAKERK